MTDFTTRIELQDASVDDYTALDQAMTGANFSKTVRSARGQEYKLPHGTYFSQAFGMSAMDVRNLAASAASRTGRRYDIVTTSGEVAYFLHPATV